jgi:hypothetical protein
MIKDWEPLQKLRSGGIWSQQTTAKYLKGEELVALLQSLIWQLSFASTEFICHRLLCSAFIFVNITTSYEQEPRKREAE